MSAYSTENLFREAADWNLFDVNVRVGPSGVHGELAMETTDLLKEMDRFFIREAVASHWTGEEYDMTIGNDALASDRHPRLTPAWSILPNDGAIAALEMRRAKAVRITPGVQQHNFSLSPWCAGALFEYLQEHAVVTLINRADIEWSCLQQLLESYSRLPVVLLDVGYRADRHLFPLLQRYPFLHFDSATYLAHRQLEAFVDQHGTAQLLFGSRLPLYTPAASLGVLSSARISNDARAAIAGGNLRALLAGARA
jgi:predicted TIM-barrel fold metal-dependent hydrolase